MNEETHHKMSKKIAQLTKVIFHLHSKNEENNSMQTAIQNAYEKEIETLLTSSNSIITRQKDALTRAQEGEAWKQKIRSLEQQHLDEKRESLEQFQEYKKRLLAKEQQLEGEHKAKVADFKSQVEELKSGFDRRVQDFKKQLDEFKQNNEAIDALKKAHAKELATHVQEHNKKYNDLLTDKLNSEDALRAQAEAEKKSLIKEWQVKLNETVKQAREQEQARFKDLMERQKEEFIDQLSALQQQLADRGLEIKALMEQLAGKEQTITLRDNEIAGRDQQIAQLQQEIARLNQIINQNGMQAGDLQNQLADTQRKLKEAENTIA